MDSRDASRRHSYVPSSRLRKAESDYWSPKKSLVINSERFSTEGAMPVRSE
jgi:hypothetical protein